MQQTGAMRAAYLKPSWCCSPISAFTDYLAQQTDMTFSLIFRHTNPVWTLGVTTPPPAPTLARPAVSGDTEDARPFSCGARSAPPRPQTLCRARLEPGCHSPGAKGRQLGWTFEGAAPRLRGCGPWLQGWAKVGSTRTIQSPESRRAGRGAPRGSQCRRREAGTSRGALSGGAGRERDAALAAGCRGSALRLRAPCRRAAAHPALGPAGAKTRSADTAAGSRPLRAPTRTPARPPRRGRCLAPSGEARARACGPLGRQD